MEVRRFRACIVRQDGECGSKPGPEQVIPENYQPCPASSPDLRVGLRHMIEPLTARGLTVTKAFFSLARQPNTQNKSYG
jgi:hypothetical protein